jgi:UDP-N-acetylmuramate dehydrogenase
MQIKENQPLAAFTTLGIGGDARWFVEATSEEEIVEAAAWTRDRGVALFVLGGGSNLLVSDAGFDGLVLRVALRGVTLKPAAGDSVLPDQVIYQAAAGEDWDALVERTVRDNCAGIECLAGIPGTVGGTPVQNVGAYGQEVSSTIERVRALDLHANTFVEFASADCNFAYRRSRFNSTDRGRFLVTRVDYRLTQNGPPTLRYADLQRAFVEDAAPSLIEVAAAVRRIRRAKGMLLVEGDPDCRSAGSFFKNPIVSEELLRRIERAGTPPPQFPAGSGQVKLPAAWLIEHSGFPKGFSLGNAGISSRHTLALVNRGNATAAEILTLAGKITTAVEARFGIHLELEPVLLGF